MARSSLILCIATALFAAAPAAPRAAEVVGPEPFGKTEDGRRVQVFTLKNGKGMVAKIITYGATLTELHVPDKDGKTADVVLGFDDVAGYESGRNQSFGCTTGRVANRIAKGTFTLEGKTYELARNNGPNHLHGGNQRALSRVVWEGEKLGPAEAPSAAGVRFTYTSLDGEEGYPGKLDLAVTYLLDDENRLRIVYKATSDRPTPVNLTNHSYFNLQGAGAATAMDHTLQIVADTYTGTDDTLIPTGKLDPVEGTALDFRKPTPIGERIAKFDAPPFGGYDHNYVLSTSAKMRAAGDQTPLESKVAAVLKDPKSGRTLTIKTTQPAVQFYTGNGLNGQAGKGGKTYPRRSAVCLETQHYPDSVNHPEFPTTILRPGEVYLHEAVYEFGTE